MTTDHIINTVTDYLNIPKDTLGVRIKTRELSEARYITMYFLRSQTELSLVKIGNEVKRDHSTAIYGLRQVGNWIDTDKTFKAKINDIAELLKN